jgi:hypothetical protein
VTSHRLRLTQPSELPSPRADSDSDAVLADAIEALAKVRTSYWLGDSAVTLHAIASLIAQARKTLPEAVAAAPDQCLTWTEIGQLLGLSHAAAARRYRNPS